MAHAKLIQNCPMTFMGISVNLFGPNIPSHKGKSIWCTPEPVRMDYVMIPLEVFLRKKWVELLADVMFMGRVPFLVKILQKIKFATVEALIGGPRHLCDS